MFNKKDSKKLYKKLLVILLIISSLSCLASCSKNDVIIESKEDLENRTVSTLYGSTYLDLIENDPILSTCKQSNGIEHTDCLALLLSGQSDAIVTDSITGQQSIYQQEGLKLLPLENEYEHYGIGFPKGSLLVDKFNVVINDLKADGTLDALLNKWISPNPELLDNTQDWLSANGTIVCMVSPDTEPINYIAVDGSYQGFEIELIMKIAETLQMRVEFKQTEFIDIISETIAGQADCFIAMLDMTESRKNAVDFTDEYLSAGTVLILRDGTVKTSFIYKLKNSFKNTFVNESRWQALLDGLKTTIAFCLIVEILALVLGSALFLLSYNEKKIGDFIIDKVYFLLTYLPWSAMLMLLYYVVFAKQGISAFIAALIFFTIAESASFGNGIRSAVSSIDQGQKEAAISMGYSAMEALNKIYLPQVMTDIVATYKLTVIEIIKMSSLLELISVADFQTIADTIRSQTYEALLPIGLVCAGYALIALVAVQILKGIHIEKHFRKETEEELKAKYLKG